MQEILSGIIFGIGVSVPIGPVNILIMSYALKSYKKAFFLGLGAMGADALYLTLLSFGILKFLNSPTGFKILAVFGAIFLTYMAILILKNSKSNIKMQKTDSFSLFGIFVKGFLINLSNPYVIAFWLSSAAVLSYMGGNFVLTLFGLITGIFLWVSLFPLVIFKARKVIGEKIANLFSYISAFILIFFSIILIFRTFWET
ncbi:LysE family translocator [Campylobacter hominis]|uniref:LysE family translocator n=1 Tax=Campylobacter hominis TaxID=76517 RepID=UPI00248ACBAD|nr:LysE family transporter [Campylobacter hominis]